MALSQANGLWATLRLMVALPRRRFFTSWRLLSLFRFTVLYMILMVTQFVWLIGITPRTTFAFLHSNVWNKDYGAGVGEFRFIQNDPVPYTGWTAWGYLSDSTEIRQIRAQSTFCSPSQDLHCIGYISIGFSSIVISNPDKREQAKDVETAIILYDVPSYVLEFKSGEQPVPLHNATDPWANCVEHTTPMESYLEMCLGGSSRASSEKSSTISAGWTFSLSAQNRTEIYTLDNEGQEAHNDTVFTTTMNIYHANTTVIIDKYNGSIIDIPQIGEYSPYAVDVSDFFQAWTAPLHHIPANNTVLLGTDHLNSTKAVDNYKSVLVNTTNTYNATVIADAWVDAMVYFLTDPMPSENPPLHLRASLAHSLVRNSGLYYNKISSTAVSQTYVLDISLISLGTYIALNLSVIMACFCMIFGFNPQDRIPPNKPVFSEVTFGTKLDEEAIEIFKGHSNTTTGKTIRYFADVEIQVGERITMNGQRRVVVTRRDSGPLRRDVSYV